MPHTVRTSHKETGGNPREFLRESGGDYQFFITGSPFSIIYSILCFTYENE